MNLVKREANDHEKLSMVNFKIWNLERDLKRDFNSRDVLDSINAVLRKFRIERDRLKERIAATKLQNLGNNE